MSSTGSRVVLLVMILGACGDGTGGGSAARCPCDDGGLGTVVEDGACLCPWALRVDASLDFGIVPRGAMRERNVLVRNVGEAPVTLTHAGFAAEGSPAFVVTGRVPAEVPPGGAVAVPVAFDPEETGRHEGTLVIEGAGVLPVSVRCSGFRPADVSGDDDEDDRLASRRKPRPARELPGAAVEEEPCRLDHPAELDFGVGVKGEEAALDLVIRNLRDDASCRVSQLRIEGGEGSDFAVEPILRTWIPAGEELPIRVRFRPVRFAPMIEDVLRFEVADPEAPERAVRLMGAAMEPCLTVTPDRLDFGAVEVGGSLVRQVQLSADHCGPRKLGSLEIVAMGDGNPAVPFTVLAAPGPGTFLPFRSAVAVEVAFAPGEEGDHAATLVATVEDDPRRYECELVGRASGAAATTGGR